eukprot:10885441-Karenia_brevis.AAC.1
MEALAWFLRALQEGLSLVASLSIRGEAGKCRWLASSGEAQQALIEPMEKLGVTYAKDVRWLGCDYQPANNGSRPNTTRRKRVAAVRRRWGKLRGWARKKTKLHGIVKQGMMASVGYGASLDGTPSPILRFLESKLAATRGGAGHFRSAVLNLGVHGWDSLAELALAPLRAYVRHTWDGEVRDMQQAAWDLQKGRLRSALDKRQRWKLVKGPLGAAWATARDIGWDMVRATMFKTASGRRLDASKLAPDTILTLAKRDFGHQKLAAWAEARESRRELQPEPWLAPLAD